MEFDTRHIRTIDTFKSSIFMGQVFCASRWPFQKELTITEVATSKFVLLRQEAETARQYGHGLIVAEQTFESKTDYYDIQMQMLVAGEFGNTGLRLKAVFAKQNKNGFDEKDLVNIHKGLDKKNDGQFVFSAIRANNARLIVYLDKKGNVGQLTEPYANCGDVTISDKGQIIIEQTTRGIMGSNLEIFAKTISIVAKSL